MYTSLGHVDRRLTNYKMHATLDSNQLFSIPGIHTTCGAKKIFQITSYTIYITYMASQRIGLSKTTR